jgi:hypothetical protein
MIFDRNRRRSADQPAGTALSSTSKQILHRSQHHQTEEDTGSGNLCVGNTTPHRRPPTPSAADVREQNETHQGPTERSTCLVWSRPRLAPLPLLSLSLFDPHEQTRRSPAVLLRISPRPNEWGKCLEIIRRTYPFVNRK